MFLHPEEGLRSDPKDRVSKPRLEGRLEMPFSKEGLKESYAAAKYPRRSTHRPAII